MGEDGGQALQASEQDLGLAVVREMFAADGLRQGRLVKLSPVTFIYEAASVHRLAYPAGLQGWGPLQALRSWLRAELEESLRGLQ